MNWFDYGMLGVIVLSTLIGLRRGFAREVLSMVALGTSLLVAFMFSDRIAPFFESYIPLPSLRQIAASVVVFVFMLLAMALLNYILVELIALTDVGGIDLWLGMIYGFLRGVFMIVLFIFLVGFTPFPKDQWWRESVLLPSFTVMAQWSCSFMPPALNKLSTFCS